MSIFGKSNSTFGSSSVFGNTNSSSNNMSFGSLGKSVASINSFGTSTNQTMTSDATKFVNSNNDTKFSEPPTDTISSLVFSPTTSNIGLAGVSSFCAATCWDKSIRIWQVDHNSKNTAPKAETIAAEFPFHCSWNDNSTQLFYASSDKSAYTWDLASNQSVKFAEHTAPIQTVHHIKTPTYTAVMTTSWDSTVKFWDLRSATPMKSIDIGGKALGADCMYPAAVILNSNRKIAVLNLNNEPSIVRMDDSLLNHLIVSIALFKGQSTGAPYGYAVGGIEARIGVKNLSGNDSKDNFAFKCHRVNQPNNVYECYTINALCTNKVRHGTIITGGSDGKFVYWDIFERTRLKFSSACNMPITAMDTSADGKIFAYGLGYDWTKGYQNNFHKIGKPCIYLRNCLDDMNTAKR